MNLINNMANYLCFKDNAQIIYSIELNTIEIKC